jgi:uncharacterized protein (DUF362 family)/Pyruvate/2-oxoacid:ferredoxin oxidoreductase delta subunit
VSVIKQANYSVSEIKSRLADVGLFTCARGDSVFLKPNLLSTFAPEKAITTHPAVVSAVAELFADAGAKITIGDSPGAVSQEKALNACGFMPVIQRLGMKIADVSKTRGVKGRRYPNLTLITEPFEADLFVNLPKVKTHGQMLLTVAVKNLFGLVPGLQKAQWHLRTGGNTDAFARLLADIAFALSTVKSLHLADGIVSMEGRGPSSGVPRETGFLAVSPSALSLDTAICRLLGFPEQKLPTNIAASALFPKEDSSPELEFLGFSQTPSLPLVSAFQFVMPERAIIPHLFPRLAWRLLRRIWLPRPFVDIKTCIRCRQCGQICAAKAISFSAENTPPQFDYTKCIRCFCCEEICPKSAIHVRTPLLRRFLSPIKGTFTARKPPHPSGRRS